MPEVIKIQRPSVGRVVLFRPEQQRSPIPAIIYRADFSQTMPALVILLVFDDHETVIGEETSIVQLIFEGRRITADYGLLDDGSPATGCWCYPPIVRDEIEVLRRPEGT